MDLLIKFTFILTFEVSVKRKINKRNKTFFDIFDNMALGHLFYFSLTPLTSLTIFLFSFLVKMFTRSSFIFLFEVN